MKLAWLTLSYLFRPYAPRMSTNPHPIQGEDFDQWFHRQKFEHFSADEFTNYFEVNRRGVRNSPPPRAKWVNIVPTLRIVDALRKHLGRSIVLTSSYRSPAYNAAISGAAAKSYHMDFKALDITVAGHSPKQVFDLLKKWRTEGKFTGGLGLYSTFVHIDTRGTNATW
jgi:uncharacterized protein YcbK (DUF882 family)